jgi:glycosyltransferase involved in cell wall biosynthesis
MKLCFLGDAGSIHTQRWVNFFAKRGHEVHLISHSATSLPNIKLHLIYSHPWVISIPNILISALQTKWIIKKIKPDIVHAHYVTDYGLYGAFSDIHPLVITAWGSDILISPNNSKINTYIVRYALKRADLITCDSEMVMKTAALYCDTPKKIFVIQWGVNLNSFKRFNSHLKKSNKTILSTRNFKPIYNIDTIIESVPYVINIFPETNFILKNGYGYLESQLRELAKQLNVLQNIKIINELVEYNEMPKFLNDADIFVSVPSSDSSSISLMEAMACGLPVVVSDLPANREWIKDGWNGYIVPVRDPEALAGALIKLLENKEQRELFGKRNQEIIIERADHEKHMLRMEELYESLLIEHKKG